MNQAAQIEPVRKSIVVGTSPQRAFEVFSSGLDRWWPKSHGIGSTPLAQSIMEPFVGGRWYSKHENGTEVTVGHVLAWEPGRRLLVTWEINAQWHSDPRPAFTSEVEVIFADAGEGRTRVNVEHRAFERMGEEGGNTMRGAVDGGWPHLLELFAQAAAA